MHIPNAHPADGGWPQRLGMIAPLGWAILRPLPRASATE